CTNFSGAPENVRLVTRAPDGTLKGNTVVTINHLATRTACTHFVAAYHNVSHLATGSVLQGTTAIAATSTNIICTAATIDATKFAPDGLALRGIRFNPIPGSQE